MPQSPEWLTPNSPATPSALGAVLVTVSLPLADETGISFKWITLVLSLGLGALVVLSIKEDMTRYLRSLYWVFNSLLVFSVSLGIAISAAPPPSPPPPLPQAILNLLQEPGSGHVSNELPIQLGLVGVARAQPPTPVSPSEDTRPEGRADSPEDRPQTQLTEEQKEELRRYLESQQQYQSDQERFHRRWSW
jgi:hypothetical protein